MGAHRLRSLSTGPHFRGADHCRESKPRAHRGHQASDETATRETTTTKEDPAVKSPPPSDEPRDVPIRSAKTLRADRATTQRTRNVQRPTDEMQRTRTRGRAPHLSIVRQRAGRATGGRVGTDPSCESNSAYRKRMENRTADCVRCGHQEPQALLQ